MLSIYEQMSSFDLKGYIFMNNPLHKYLFHMDIDLAIYGTGGFMKKVLSVYTHSMTTIYLSLSAQVAISTFFMKSPLLYYSVYIIVSIVYTL